jgi:hypothetical protein
LPTGERRRDVGRRREEVHGVDVVGRQRIALRGGDVEPGQRLSELEGVCEIALGDIAGVDAVRAGCEPGAEVAGPVQPFPLGHAAAHVAAVDELEAVRSGIEEPRHSIGRVHQLAGGESRPHRTSLVDRRW